MNSFTEENYLKAIFKLHEADRLAVSTNSIAEKMNTKAATVTDMLKKLAAKNLINYTRYQGVSLTAAGRKIALSIIRKHRLWELFLVEKLNFRWNEVHDIAEQLEHVHSSELVERLDKYLGFPKHDPHGDPIPDNKGRMSPSRSALLETGEAGKKYIMTGVADHDSIFLEYLDKLGFSLGCEIKVESITAYDRSLHITLNRKKTIHISNDVARNILISQLR
ncbi:MAG TPA: metal-dependent transcriptional regulator [Bacteroidia bacterium]|jgi:DtxR family Mn-dependent transcriptional regulator|nr:metal-dependent transcriptional regulator [Bacteroidia bacterium]